MAESDHLESAISFASADGAGEKVDDRVPKAQDLHAILEVILDSYVELQDKGFAWDLFYKGRVHQVEFVMFTPFFKVDSDEAERLCGKYTSRTKNVGCLCRYCQCPTSESDLPFVKYQEKRWKEIQRLVDNNDEEELKAMSQHKIQNALYKIRFGAHNNFGVHSACPMDMLHFLLLGIFRYTRDCFFELIGPESKLSDEVEAVATKYGALLSRQSYRDFPTTRFNGGIRKGKLNAKDFPGILLCLACALQCGKIRGLLRKKKSYIFDKDEKMLNDWLMLLETLLQWERWLKSEELQVSQVKKAERKHRQLMYYMKKVAKRTKGMGYKITKYHSIMHIATDILNFGVPLEVDTGSNESAHKSEKIAARLTQKNKETFDMQTYDRLEEVHLLDLASEEINGRAVYNYFQPRETVAENDEDSVKDRLTGEPFYVKFDANSEKNYAVLQTRKRKQVQGPILRQKLEQSLVDFVAGLQEKVRDFYQKMLVYPGYVRNGVIFRASTNFRGNYWLPRRRNCTMPTVWIC